jgi:hypothetical protein
LAGPNFCGFLTQADIDTGSNLLKSVAGVARQKIGQVVRGIEQDFKNANLLSRHLKDLFATKAPERISRYLGVPWRRVMRLRLAGYYLSVGQFERARKHFRSFGHSLPDRHFTELRIFALSAYLLPNGVTIFKETVSDII